MNIKNFLVRAKIATKALVAKASNLITRAYRAVTSFVKPVFRSRFARVIASMSRYCAFAVSAGIGVAALFLAPLQTVIAVCAAVLVYGVAWVVGRFCLSLLANAAVRDSRAARKTLTFLGYVARALRFLGNVVVALFQGFSFAAFVALSTMSVAGVIQFGLLSWLFWAHDVEQTSDDPRERDAARLSMSHARLASDVVSIYEMARQRAA